MRERLDYAPYVFSGGLKVTPNVLPASCRQTVACRIVPFCRQDAGSTLTRYGELAPTVAGPPWNQNRHLSFLRLSCFFMAK